MFWRYEDGRLIFDPMGPWPDNPWIFWKRFVVAFEDMRRLCFLLGSTSTYDLFSTLRSPQEKWVSQCFSPKDHQCWSLKVFSRFWWRHFDDILGESNISSPKNGWFRTEDGPRWASFLRHGSSILNGSSHGRCCVTIWSTSPRSRKGGLPYMSRLVSEINPKGKNWFPANHIANSAISTCYGYSRVQTLKRESTWYTWWKGGFCRRFRTVKLRIISQTICIDLCQTPKAGHVGYKFSTCTERLFAWT